MKKLKIIFCFVVLLFSKQVYTQTNFSLSINAGTVIPIGNLADLYSTGFDVGIKLLKLTRNKNITFSGGFLYSHYPRINEEINSDDSNETSSITKLFLGPQIPIGKKKQFYIFPNIAGNFSGGSFRLGIDGILGFEIQVSTNSYFDISFRYELQNIVGKKDEESTISALHLAIGVGMKF